MPSGKEKVGIGAIVAVVVVLVAIAVSWSGLIHRCDDQNFQVVQSVSGQVTVRNEPGWYMKFFPTITTYNRVQEAYFSADTSGKEGGDTDDSIRVTFNDGGVAKISCFASWKLPEDNEMRRELHRRFAGNNAGIEGAIRSALINVAKNTAPLMSASENQSARKAEFAQLIDDQMRVGVYKMKRSLVASENVGEDGKTIETWVTEIVRDNAGKPVISQESPLKKYGFEIIQFSVTGTDYDDQTRSQFAAKKDAMLKAELSKSQKEEETQRRLQVIEKGLREKAEIEAKMNVERTQAVINAEKEKQMAEIAAQQKVAVEQQAKLEAEVKLAKDLAIAQKEKEIAETLASQKLEVAKIEKAEAVEKAEAMVKLAEAKQKEIELSGAITEQEKIRLEIAKETSIGVAKANAEGIKGMNWPRYMNIGSGGESNGTQDNPMNYLFQMWMVNKVDTEVKPVGNTPTVSPNAPKVVVPNK